MRLAHIESSIFFTFQHINVKHKCCRVPRTTLGAGPRTLRGSGYQFRHSPTMYTSIPLSIIYYYFMVKRTPASWVGAFSPFGFWNATAPPMAGGRPLPPAQAGAGVSLKQ